MFFEDKYGELINISNVTTITKVQPEGMYGIRFNFTSGKNREILYGRYSDKERNQEFERIKRYVMVSDEQSI